MKKISCLFLIFLPFLTNAQLVTSFKGEVKYKNKTIRAGERLPNDAKISLGKNAILVFRKQNGNFVLENKNAQTKEFLLTDAKPANKINMEGNRDINTDFYDLPQLRSYFYHQEQKTMLLVGENTFALNDKRFPLNDQTNFYLFPQGVENTQNGILLPKKNGRFVINAEILAQKNIQAFQVNSFQLIYEDKDAKLSLMTNCKLIFADKTEVLQTIQAIFEDMKNQQGEDILTICLETLENVYGKPDSYFVRKTLIDLGAKF